jgi:hypothetical protein
MKKLMLLLVVIFVFTFIFNITPAFSQSIGDGFKPIVNPDLDKSPYQMLACTTNSGDINGAWDQIKNETFIAEILVIAKNDPDMVCEIKGLYKKRSGFAIEGEITANHLRYLNAMDSNILQTIAEYFNNRIEIRSKTLKAKIQDEVNGGCGFISFQDINYNLKKILNNLTEEEKKELGLIIIKFVSDEDY